MYELKEISFDKDEDKIYSIEDEDAKSLIYNFEYLGTNMRSYYYYQIVKRNLNELIGFIREQQNKLDEIDAIECNRLLFNYIDTLYGYINFFEKNYKANFKSIKQEIYDSYFEYRFIYNLRNFIIHEDLGILSVSKQIYENSIVVRFNVSKNKLINSSRFQPSVRQEIEKRFVHDIDIFPILEKQFEVIKLLQEKMLLSLSNDILSRFDFISKLIRNNKEIFLIQNRKIINGLLNVTTKFYTNLADNYIYEENYIKTDNSIRRLFMKLSYSYYKEPTAIYKSKKHKKDD